MGDVAGWDMPMQYDEPANECQTVRERAGVFDISHMGRLLVRGDGALNFMERVCKFDVVHQEDDTAERTLICGPAGETIARAMVLRLENQWLLTIDPADHAAAWEHLQPIAEQCGARLTDQTPRTSQLSVVGPAAGELLDAVLPIKVAHLPSGAAKTGSIMIARYIAFRANLAGLWSLEVIVPNMLAGQAWDFITKKAGENCIPPAGLTARDLLRSDA